MTILFVTLSLSGGGAERVVSVLGSELSKHKDVNVHMLVFGKKANEYPLAKQVVRHQMEEETYSNKIKRVLYIRKILKNVKPDFVIPFLNEPSMYTYLAKLGIKTKFIATVRNNPEYYVGKGYRGRIIKYITEHADMCMLQTEEQAAYFCWKSTEHCFVVPNPIKEEMFDSQFIYRPNVSKIVTCGRLNKQKNHEKLIRVFSELSKKNPSLVLLIYGEGEEKDNLLNLISQLNLNNKVILMGRTENVLKALQESDIFMLSSDYEGMPNALMEALAVGMPCISTDCPTGPSSLIRNGIDGVLVRTDDEMQEAIAQLICNREERIRLGINAKSKMQQLYSAKAVSEQFLNFLYRDGK